MPGKKDKKTNLRKQPKECHINMLLFVSPRRRIITPKLPTLRTDVSRHHRNRKPTLILVYADRYGLRLSRRRRACVSPRYLADSREEFRTRQSQTRANEGTKKGAMVLSGRGGGGAATCCLDGSTKHALVSKRHLALINSKIFQCTKR